MLRLMSDLKAIKQAPPEVCDLLVSVFHTVLSEPCTGQSCNYVYTQLPHCKVCWHCCRRMSAWLYSFVLIQGCCIQVQFLLIQLHGKLKVFPVCIQGCSASPVTDDNLFVWTASVFGPDDTPWEGGIFSLKITFSERYPEKPPRVRFTSEVFHPNVYGDGAICMDIIQDQWSPCHSVCTLLMSILSLLTDPNCASPANPEAAQVYQNDRKEYNRCVPYSELLGFSGCFIGIACCVALSTGTFVARSCVLADYALSVLLYRRVRRLAQRSVEGC